MWKDAFPEHPVLFATSTTAFPSSCPDASPKQAKYSFLEARNGHYEIGSAVMDDACMNLKTNVLVWTGTNVPSARAYHTEEPH